MRSTALCPWVVLASALASCSPPETGWTSLDELEPASEATWRGAPDALVHEPPELRSIATGRLDATGAPLRASCETCHGIEGLATAWRGSAEALGPPHTGIVLAHGTNRCESCHDRDHRLALRTADGRSIPMVRAMELCRQCHGPQARDYDHGSHGGLFGAWDAARGPRTRAHCLDCHDAHAPAWEPLAPMPPPRDRSRPARRGEEAATPRE